MRSRSAESTAAATAARGEPGEQPGQTIVVQPASRAASLARAVLDGNWRQGEREGIPFAYTCPSPTRYPWQWYWDSCFCVIARRRDDPARGLAELRSLLAAQREDGFIGHTIFWDTIVKWSRLPYYNVMRRQSWHTHTIQPPMLAWAWRLCGADPAEDPRIALHHGWLRRERDLEGDGLLWIIQPDESGLDASTKFDAVWGWRRHARPGFPLLVHRNRRLDFNARRILAAGGPLVCEVLTNVLWSLSLQAAGEPSITRALVDRLWDPASGLFLDEVLPGGARPHALTWAALSPLALPDLPTPIGRRLVEEHLIPRFLTTVPIPSVPPGEPGYRHGAGWIRAYWRGPSWANAAWMLWLGLVRLGYAGEAERVREGWVGAVAREGLREFYDPDSGRGLGTRDFGWSALVLDMLANDPAAAHSYLPPPKPVTAPPPSV